MGQDRVDELKEVADATARERRLNRHTGVPLAHPPVAHVGVGHSIIARCWIRLQRNDVVDATPMRLAQAGNPELYLERSEIDPFQFNGLRGDGERLVSCVVRQIAEFIIRLKEVLEDIPQRWNLNRAVANRMLRLINVVCHLAQPRFDGCGGSLHSGFPSAACADGKPVLYRFQPLHLLQYVLQLLLQLRAAVALHGSHLITNPIGDPNEGSCVQWHGRLLPEKRWEHPPPAK